MRSAGGYVINMKTINCSTKCNKYLYYPYTSAGLKNCNNLPAEMKIDYIRLYQDADSSEHTLSCSPPDFPTSTFIADFSERYKPWDIHKKLGRDGAHENFNISHTLLYTAIAIIVVFAALIHKFIEKIIVRRRVASCRCCGIKQTTEYCSQNNLVSELSPLVVASGLEHAISSD